MNERNRFINSGLGIVKRREKIIYRKNPACLVTD